MDLGLTQIGRGNEQFKRAYLRAEKALKRGRTLPACAWAQVAADIAWHRHPGFLVSPPLESLLLDVARNLSSVSAGTSAYSRFQPDEGSTKRRVLHVVTKLYKTGGHTRTIERLINNWGESAVHGVVATYEGNSIPESLASSIAQTGGRFTSLANSGNLLRRAIILRQIATSWADLVILHQHGFDAVPVLAFGRDGGPPVVLFNHGDHAFWLGASIADVVVDFRLLGQKLSRDRRGVRKSQLLPLPLSGPKPKLSLKATPTGLGGTVTLLTVGAQYKYTAFGGYDFIETIVRILARNPKAILLAVGSRPDRRWTKASLSVGGRIKALGPRTDVEPYFASADLYLPSFPFGGVAALLEACLRGIPIVGMLNQDAPILCEADDPSFEGLHTHFSPVEFDRHVEELIADGNLRQRKGAETRDHVMSVHTGTGWRNQLDQLRQSLPSEHEVKVPEPFDSPIDRSDAFLAGFDSVCWANYTLPTVIAKHLGKFPTQELPEASLEMIHGVPSLLAIPPNLALSSFLRLASGER